MNELKRLEEWQAKDAKKRRVSIKISDDFLQVYLSDGDTHWAEGCRHSELNPELSVEDIINQTIDQWEKRYPEVTDGEG